MIKKQILFFALILVANIIFAQQNIIKASTVIGNLGLQYERSITNNISIVGQVGYSNINVSINNADTRSKGLGYYLEGKYYFFSKKGLMEGWHIGPYYNSLNTKTDDDLETDISSIGITSGYQWVFDSKITLGLIFGAGTLNSDSDIPEFEAFGDFNFLPNLGINIGYNF